MKLRQRPTAKISNTPLLFHLQVVQYVGYVDCEDTENGHGTHVGGSAAGGMSHASPGDHFGDGVSWVALIFSLHRPGRGGGKQGCKSILKQY